VRSDLPYGVQVAQTAHAAGESVAESQAPLPDGTIVVALSVPSEGALLRIAQALGEHSLTHKLIMESDGPYAGQAMALGIRPTRDRAAVRKAVSSLPLVK
jgi:hypothetical protein